MENKQSLYKKNVTCFLNPFLFFLVLVLSLKVVFQVQTVINNAYNVGDTCIMIERGANINLRKPFPITITFPGQDGYTFDAIPLKKTYIKYLFSKQIISLMMGILMLHNMATIRQLK